MDEVSGNAIADTVLNAFDALPQKRKPLTRAQGVKEWVPLSGIVAQGREKLTCLAAATGMKCLPQSKIAMAQGVALHDWHAEILAIRSFNSFLLEECHALALSRKQSSEYVRFRSLEERTEAHFQPFALNDGINLHMYCSEAPCGDASMELTMAAQEDATPWELPPVQSLPSNESKASGFISLSSIESKASLHGRSYFSCLGLVRRKPSRPDAPPTLSKSCSDKLTLKQSTSLLSSLSSLLISPENIYIHTLVLPSSQFSSPAVTRCFSPAGRLSPLTTPKAAKDWSGGYIFSPFTVKSTEREFQYSKRQKLVSGEKIVPSNIATAHTPQFTETLIGGTLQGKKQFSLKGASRVSNRRSWKLALEIAKTVGGLGAVDMALSARSYRLVKQSELLGERRRVKEDVRSVLGGWVSNEGGEEFELDGLDA